MNRLLRFMATWLLGYLATGSKRFGIVCGNDFLEDED